MRLIYFHLLTILLLFPVLANAQCTLPSGSILINEITPDPGNYDGQGAEWTELFNTTGATVNLDCWVLTDGEEIIRFPAGASIPAGGFYVIYNSNFFNCATCNWDPSISTLLGASPATSLDLATCGCTNQASPFSVTWDNGGATDRIVLFDCDGTIQDAVYWGNGEKEAPAAIPILETSSSYGASTFLLGGACGYDAAIDWTIPALTDGIWENLQADIVGCTTSKRRTSDGGATWDNDFYPSPGQTNTLQDYEFDVVIDGVTTTLTNAQLAAGELKLDLCAGRDIDFRARVFGYNQVYSDMDGDDGDTGDEANGVPNIANNAEGGSSRGASSISATGGIPLANVAWMTEQITSGTTELTFDGAVVNSSTEYKLIVKENTQGPIINPTTQGGLTTILGSGAASECYATMTIKVNIVPAIVSATYTCSNGNVTVVPSPLTATGLTYELLDGAAVVQTSTNGKFTVTSAATAPAGYSIRVTQSPACGGPVIATGPGICVFTPPCPTAIATLPCTTASAAKCPDDVITMGISGTALPEGGTVEWMKGTSAAFNPYTTGTSVGSVIVPAANCGVAPSGGPVINEVLYNARGGTILPQCDAQANSGEFIEIAGTPGSSIGCWIITDGDWAYQLPSTAVIPTDGFFVIGSNLSSTGGATCTASNVDFATPGQLNFTNVSATNGEFIALYDSTKTLMDGVIWGGMPNTNSNSPNGQNIAITTGAGCPAPGNITIVDFSPPTPLNTPPVPWAFVAGSAAATFEADNQSVERNVDVTGTWQLTDNLVGRTGAADNQTPGTSNGTCIVVNPPCFDYTVTQADCGTTLFFKPKISPVPTQDETGAPITCEPTLATALQYGVTCPTATISGQIAICAGASTEFPISFDNFGANPPTVADPYTVSYRINGGAIQTATATTNPFIVTGISAATPGMTATGGVITLVSVTDGAGPLCNMKTMGDVTVTIETAIPSAPSTSVTPSTSCAGAPVILETTVTPINSNIFWYDDAALTILEGQSNPLVYTAVATGVEDFYLVAVNPDNSCKSATSAASVDFNCVFPIELLSFTGEAHSQNILLKWFTNTELNNNYFEIQKSTDLGQNFHPIGWVEGAGTTNETQFYQFTDNFPQHGNNYYRLRQIDIDGQYNYSHTVEVYFGKEHELEVVDIFPNPTYDKIQIKTFSYQTVDLTLSLFDTQGKRVLQKNHTTDSGFTLTSLSLENLESGIYFLKIQLKGKEWVRKIIKQ